MDTSTSRAVVIGVLTIVIPAAVGILLVPFLGLRMFGPHLFLYYVVAGIAIGWQWCLANLPRWKGWLSKRGIQDKEIEDLAHRTGLARLEETAIGPWAFHTTAAAVCGIHLGPWLLSRWFVWILPLAGISTGAPTGNDYLQHFELASIVPACVIGYLLVRYFPRLALWAWILPTGVLLYKLLTFTEPYASVIAPHSSTRLSYFFVIQRSMPTFTVGFGGVDPIRVAQQMFVVAPFYAGVAYSVGALAASHNLLEKLFGHSPSVQPEPKLPQTERADDGIIEGEIEKPANERD